MPYLLCFGLRLSFNTRNNTLTRIISDPLFELLVWQGLQMRPGDWICTACGDHVFAKNTSCRKCGQAWHDCRGCEVGPISDIFVVLAVP